MSLSIREMEERDIPVVCDLMFELTGHPISHEGMKNRLDLVKNSPIEELYVCEVISNGDGGKVAGVFGFRIRENLEEASRFGEISVIVTSAASRRFGIGRAMMEYAEKRAKEKGCIGTWLVSGFGREEEAHRFYQNLGYKVNGYRFIKPFEEE